MYSLEVIEKLNQEAARKQTLKPLPNSSGFLDLGESGTIAAKRALLESLRHLISRKNNDPFDQFTRERDAAEAELADLLGEAPVCGPNGCTVPRRG